MDELLKEFDSVRFIGVEALANTGYYAWFEYQPNLLAAANLITPEGDTFPGYRVRSSDLEKRKRKLIENDVQPTETDKAISEIQALREKDRAVRSMKHQKAREAGLTPTRW